MKTLERFKSKDLILLLNQSNFNFEKGSWLDRKIRMNDFPIYSASNKVRVASATGIISSAMAIDILWAVISVFATGITLTSILLGGFVLGAGFLGLLYAVNSYQKSCKIEEKNILEYKTSLFKLMILEELKKRQQLKLKKEVHNYLIIQEKLNDTLKMCDLSGEKSPNNILTKIKKIHTNYLVKLKFKSKINFTNEKEIISHLLTPRTNSLTIKKSKSTDIFRSRTRKIVGEGIALSSVLFASFFWSSSAIMTALGLTAAATIVSGPIGAGIALGLSIAVGVIYAYHLHKKIKITKEQKNLNASLKEKIVAYQTEYELANNNVKLVQKMQCELMEAQTNSAQMSDQYLSSNNFWQPKIINRVRKESKPIDIFTQLHA